MLVNTEHFDFADLDLTTLPYQVCVQATKYATGS